MTWDTNNFATLSRTFEGGSATFGADSKGRIIDFGNVKNRYISINRKCSISWWS